MPTPTLNVAKDGSRTWKVRFREGGRGARETSRTFGQEAKALWFSRLIDQIGAIEAARILDEQLGGAAVVDHTLASWMLHHIDQITGVTDGTRKRYRSQTRAVFTGLAELPLAAVTAERIEAWVNLVHTKGPAGGRPVKGKTIANWHGLLSSALDRAVRAELLPANPAQGTRMPRDEQEEMVFLSAAEFDHLLSHVPARGRGIVSILPLTGLRFGEITALHVSAVDLTAARLTVKQAWKYTGQSQVVLGPPKSRRSRRTIALPPQVVEALRDAIQGKTGGDLIFTNSHGGHWLSRSFHQGIWQPAVRAAMDETLHKAPEGEEPACAHPVLTKRPRVHDMRHTCASWMLAQRVRIDVVQRHLGHESIQTTIDRYGHLDPDALADAAAALGRAGRVG